MLLVKTKIGPSKIQGIGLFANQFIPKGTRISKYQPNFDLIVEKNELNQLSKTGREQFTKYAYLNKTTQKYVLCFDDARYFNHSDNPNCIEIESPNDSEGINIANRDIIKGEELTCNYKEFDQDFDYKMSIKQVPYIK